MQALNIEFGGKEYLRANNELSEKVNPHSMYLNTEQNEFLVLFNPKKRYHERNLQYQRQVHERIMKLDSSLYPNIVKILKVEQHDDGDKILMEKGQEDLKKFLNGTISDRIKLLCLQGVASAIQQIHSLGIIHRDIKASNFIVFQDGDHYIMKIIDFDISFCVDSDYVLDNQGTDKFKAPELFDQQKLSMLKNYTKIDIWSFGILLYETMLESEEYSFQKKSQEEIDKRLDKFIEKYENSVYRNTFAQIINLIKATLRVNYNERMHAQNIINSLQNIIDTYPIEIKGAKNQFLKLTQKEGKFYDQHGNVFDLKLGNPYQMASNDSFDTEKLKTQLSQYTHIIENNNIKFILEVLINLITIKYAEINKEKRQFQIDEEYLIHLNKFNDPNRLVEQIQHNLVYHYVNNPILYELIQIKWNFQDKFYVFRDKLILIYTSILPEFQGQISLVKEQDRFFYYSTILDLQLTFNCKKILPTDWQQRRREQNVILIKYYLPDINILAHDEQPTINELLQITYTLIFVSEYLFSQQLMFNFEQSKTFSYKYYVIKYICEGTIQFASTYRFIRKLQINEQQIVSGIILFIKQWTDSCPESRDRSFYDSNNQTFKSCKSQLRELIKSSKVDESAYKYKSVSISQLEQSNTIQSVQSLKLQSEQLQIATENQAKVYKNEQSLPLQSNFQKQIENLDSLQSKSTFNLEIDFSNPEDLFYCIKEEITHAQGLFKQRQAFSTHPNIVKTQKSSSLVVFQLADQYEILEIDQSTPEIQLITDILKYWKTHVDKIQSEDKIRLKILFYDQLDKFNSFYGFLEYISNNEPAFKNKQAQVLKYFVDQNFKYEPIQLTYIDILEAIRTELQASEELMNKYQYTFTKYGNVKKQLVNKQYIFACQFDNVAKITDQQGDQIISNILAHWKSQLNSIYGEDRIRLKKLFYDEELQFNGFEDIIKYLQKSHPEYKNPHVLKMFAIQDAQVEPIKPIYNEFLEGMKTELQAAEELFNHYQYVFTKYGNVVKQLIKNQYFYVCQYDNVTQGNGYQIEQILRDVQAYWMAQLRLLSNEDQFYLNSFTSRRFDNSQSLISAIERKLPHQVAKLDEKIIEELVKFVNKDQIMYLDRVLYQFDLKFPRNTLRQLFKGYDQEQFKKSCCDKGPTLTFLIINSEIQSQLYPLKQHVIAIYLPMSYSQNGEFIDDDEGASFIVSLTKQKLYTLVENQQPELLYCGEGGEGEFQILIAQDLIIAFNKSGYPQINEYRLETFLPPGEVEDGKIQILDESAPQRDLYIQEIIVYGFQ